MNLSYISDFLGFSKKGVFLCVFRAGNGVFFGLCGKSVGRIIVAWTKARGADGKRIVEGGWG